MFPSDQNIKKDKKRDWKMFSIGFAKFFSESFDVGKLYSNFPFFLLFLPIRFSTLDVAVAILCFHL
jgi:hypothetical protein